MQTLITCYVGDAAAGLGLNFLPMSKRPFSLEAGHLQMYFDVAEKYDHGKQLE